MAIYLLIETTKKQHTIDLCCLRVVDFEFDVGPRGCSWKSLDVGLSTTPRPPPHNLLFQTPPHVDLLWNDSLFGWRQKTKYAKLEPFGSIKVNAQTRGSIIVSFTVDCTEPIKTTTSNWYVSTTRLVLLIRLWRLKKLISYRFSVEIYLFLSTSEAICRNA